MGRRCPITPVDITMLRWPRPSLGSLGKQEDAFTPIARASSSPPIPVTALAQPELTIMPRTPSPFLVSSMDLLILTGAAWNLLVVKTAAAEHGFSEAMNARSGNLVLEALTPTWVPDTLKPLGYVPEVGTYFCFDSGIEDSRGAEYALD